MATRKKAAKTVERAIRQKKRSGQNTEALPKKEIKAYFLRLGAKKGEDPEGKRYFTPEEVQLLLNGVCQLQLNRSAEYSRYSDESEDPICLLSERDSRATSLRIPTRKGFLAGAIFKQRRTNYPFEDNGEALLVELKLKNDAHVLAEVAYWLANIETGLIAFHSNRYVTGTNRLASYLTEKWKLYLKQNSEAISAEVNLLKVKGGTGKVFADFIPNTNSIQEFQGMNNVRSLELGLSGRPTDLDDLLDSRDSVQKRTARALDPTQWLRGERISIRVSGSSLDEKNIQRFFRALKTMQNVELKKFVVQGQIDADSRTIDLVDDLLTYIESIPVRGRYLSPDMVLDVLEKGYANFLDRIPPSDPK